MLDGYIGVRHANWSPCKDWRLTLLSPSGNFFNVRLHTRTWEFLCVSSYLLIIMEAPAFSECVVWTLVHFAESLKRCDLYMILAAISQQRTQPRQSYNCCYAIIQAIHFSSDTERFKSQKIDIAHVDWQLNRSSFLRFHLLSLHRPGLGTFELHGGDMLFTVWLSASLSKPKQRLHW